MEIRKGLEQIFKRLYVGQNEEQSWNLKFGACCTVFSADAFDECLPAIIQHSLMEICWAYEALTFSSSLANKTSPLSSSGPEASPDSEYLSLIRYLSFFSVLDNRLLADNLSQLSKVSIWLRKGREEVFVYFYLALGLLFYSDLTQTNEIWLLIWHLCTFVAKWDMF